VKPKKWGCVVPGWDVFPQKKINVLCMFLMLQHCARDEYSMCPTFAEIFKGPIRGRASVVGALTGGSRIRIPRAEWRNVCWHAGSEFWGYHSGGVKVSGLIGCGAVSTFRRFEVTCLFMFHDVYLELLKPLSHTSAQDCRLSFAGRSWKRDVFGTVGCTLFIDLGTNFLNLTI
jgi:hypothetical protein